MNKHSHRQYCTGFYFGAAKESFLTSRPAQEFDFVGVVKGEKNGLYAVEQRGRFAVGEALETLCAKAENSARTFELTAMFDEDGAPLADAKAVQQTVLISCPVPLQAGDMLRRRRV